MELPFLSSSCRTDKRWMGLEWGGPLQTVVSTNTLAVTAADANNVMNIYKARYQKIFMILIVYKKPANRK